MEDLISKSKLLEWLDIEIDLSEGSDPVLKVDRWAFIHVKKEVESGRPDPDPIPLPTIKPGDKPKQSCPYCGSTGIHYCPRKVEVSHD